MLPDPPLCLFLSCSPSSALPIIAPPQLPRHPHVVRLHAVFETRHELILVMERARGGELFDRIVARGQFSEREAAEVGGSVGGSVGGPVGRCRAVALLLVTA